MPRRRHTRASEVTKLLQTLVLATNSPRLQADPSVISSTSERRSTRFLQRHPVVAAPGRRPPMGNHGTECYLSKCPERSAGTTSSARRWRQTCATRQTSTHSSCGGTGSWRHPAACLRLPATDGTSLPHTRCVHRAAQPWIDITRQLLFECVREFNFHDIETEFERTKQIAQVYIACIG